MPVRTIALTAIIASCVSSLVAFTLGLLMALTLFRVPVAEAQGVGTPTPPAPGATRLRSVRTDRNGPQQS